MSAADTRDRYRTLTVWAVMLVAAIAAAVSYLHIESLAVRYGQPTLAACLLPLSIDGTVAVSSLAMLRSARAGVTSPWLARTMLLLAVGATVACNVGYGLAHGIPGALLSGWPAVAFVGCAEVAISMSRRTGKAPAREHATVPVKRAPAKRARTAKPRATVTPETAELAFGARLSDGDVPSLREVKSTLRLGTDRAREIRTHLLNAAGVSA